MVVKKSVGEKKVGVKKSGGKKKMGVKKIIKVKKNVGVQIKYGWKKNQKLGLKK